MGLEGVATGTSDGAELTGESLDGWGGRAGGHLALLLKLLLVQLSL